jgi:GAF domain-containing protein/CheY-like chemotaxis protein
MFRMSSSPEYVLVAEPHPPTAAAILRALAEAHPGAESRVAADGNVGHELLAKHGPPRLLIVELALPKRDGFALIRGLRRLDKARAVRAIATSSFTALRTNASDLDRELGPLSVLAKPLSHASLVAAIQLALPRSATQPPAPPPPLPPRAAPRIDERARLARIEEMGVSEEVPSDVEIQRIVTDTARELGVPTALVTIVLESKQWFKSFVGLGGDLLANRGTSRSWAFCHHVVEGNDALIVPNARESPTFRDNPLVVDGTVGGYAGAPIVTPHGEVLGTLCVLDTKPLTIGAADVERLRILARRVAGELELSAARRRLLRVSLRLPRAEALPSAGARAVALECLASATSALASGVVAVDASRRVLFANDAFHRLFDLRIGELIGARHAVVVSRLSRRFSDPADALARLAAPDEGPFAFCEDLPLVDGRVIRFAATPVGLPGGSIQILSTNDARFSA